MEMAMEPWLVLILGGDGENRWVGIKCLVLGSRKICSFEND